MTEAPTSLTGLIGARARAEPPEEAGGRSAQEAVSPVAEALSRESRKSM